MSSRRLSLRVFDVNASSSGDTSSITEVSHLSLRRNTIITDSSGSRPTCLRLTTLGSSFSKLSDIGHQSSFTSIHDPAAQVSDQSSPVRSERLEELNVTEVIFVLSIMRDPFLLENPAEALLDNRYSLRSLFDALGDDLRQLKTTQNALSGHSAMASVKCLLGETLHGRGWFRRHRVLKTQHLIGSVVFRSFKYPGARG